MASRRSDTPKSRRRKPAETPQGRETQMVSKAIDLAEQQLEDGTASAQVITHYLKLGSSREQLEQERLRQENLMLEEKIESIKSGRRVEELYEDALNAMRAYSGHNTEAIDYDEG